MNGFFNLDGPFYKWGTEVADIMILSLLWLVCCIPIVTIGASTTALFYVCGKKARKEDVYVFRGFFKSFKENFLQGTLLTIIFSLLWYSGYLYFRILTSGAASNWVKIAGLFFIIQLIFITLYVFPILSRFDMPIKNIILSSFIFANRHFISTIICAVLFGVCVFVTLSLSPFSIFAFGIYAMVSSFLFQRIFTKYIESLDMNEQGNEEEELDEEEELEEETEVQTGEEEI